MQAEKEMENQFININLPLNSNEYAKIGMTNDLYLLFMLSIENVKLSLNLYNGQLTNCRLFCSE